MNAGQRRMPDAIFAWPSDVSPARELALTGLWGQTRYPDEAERYERVDAKSAATVSALVAAYRNAAHQLITSEDLQWGHRAGVRDVAMRLGLYEEFNAALKAEARA